jgi:hypothetical protein
VQARGRRALMFVSGHGFQPCRNELQTSSGFSRCPQRLKAQSA